MRPDTESREQESRFDHSYVGIAVEARKAIGCEGTYAEGDCFANVPEPNDYDLCLRCHLAWRIDLFENEATGWWHELGVLDGKLGFANGEKNKIRAAAMAVVEQERPDHEHYGDPCALCDLFVVLGVETREEQVHA